jgi:ankyrin repeat protein
MEMNVKNLVLLITLEKAEDEQFYLDIAELLIERGANGNHSDENGTTSLMKFISNDDLNTVQALIENRADIYSTIKTILNLML